MENKTCTPFLKRGRTFNPVLPDQLARSEPPIVLAEVTVDVSDLDRPCVLVKFSEFIQFSLLGLNPKLDIFYRLVRKTNQPEDAQILQEWEFLFEAAQVTEIANLDTNQPTVLNFCDCLEDLHTDSLTYSLEIVEIVTNSVKSYSIMNKSLSATVICEEVSP
ncbi:DUF4489 domain-containing protein [Pseudalkalibacillus sp. SCS-8]|uniref:DUF4489 domain-containing protein n=1 Tax=Pseudalkalibacillus nanhaiensis TaxID=3115291 RepID=UPI0032DBDEC2